MEFFKKSQTKFLSIMIISALIITTFMSPAMVWAEETDDITIGTESYQTLQSAVSAANNDDVISINRNITSSAVNVDTGKNLIIDLKGNSIDTSARIKIFNNSKLTIKDTSAEKSGRLVTSDEPIFFIDGGELNLDSGEYHSTCEENHAFGIIMIGSTEQSDENYSVLNIGENATISFKENGYGISINKPDNKKYGIVANIDGTIKATGNKEGGAIYINGTMNDMTGEVPKINISETAILKGRIYAAGYGIWDIDGGDFKGLEVLSIKSGEFDISGGTFKSTGPYYNPVDANSNGSDNTGAVVSMTSNDSYAPDIHMNISGGTFESENGNAIYEGIPVKDQVPAADATHVKELSVSGGTFIGASEKEAVDVTTYNSEFISGGSYNTSPDTNYIKSDCIVVQSDNMYNIIPAGSVVGIVLNTTSTSLEVGNKEQLTAKIIPDDADNKKFSWSSEDSNIASISEHGVVEAKEVGETTVSAITEDGNKTATCKITVTDKTTSENVIKVQPSVATTSDGATSFNSEDIIETMSNAGENENIVIVAPENVKAPSVPKDVFEAASSSKSAPKQLIIETKADDNTYGASFEFDLSKITNPVEVKTEISVKDTTTDSYNQLPSGAQLVGLDLKHHGDFPAPATITLALKGDISGDKAYIYHVPTYGALLLTDNDPLNVVNNKVTFNLTHASEYILTDNQIPVATAAGIITGLINNIGDVIYTGEIKNKIRTANEGYEGFKKQYDEDSLELITNVKVLTDAKAEYDALQGAVDTANTLISEIGNISTIPSQTEINKTRSAASAYNALTVEQKSAVDGDTLDDAVEIVIAYTTGNAKAAIKNIPAFTSIQLANESTVRTARTSYDYAINNDINNLAKTELAGPEATLLAAEKRINKAKAFSGAATVSVSKYTYNGGSKSPSVSINGLVAGKDYTVSYVSNIKVGKATVNITGINDCQNLPSKTTTFIIAPAKAGVSKIKKGKKSLKVTVKNQKKTGITGYQIAYSTKKNKSFKTTTTTKTSKTIKKLKAYKTYYVKVRGYKVIDGKKVYGPYSSVKKMKTK